MARKQARKHIQNTEYLGWRGKEVGDLRTSFCGKKWLGASLQELRKVINDNVRALEEGDSLLR